MESHEFPPCAFAGRWAKLGQPESILTTVSLPTGVEEKVLADVGLASVRVAGAPFESGEICHADSGFTVHDRLKRHHIEGRETSIKVRIFVCVDAFSLTRILTIFDAT